MPLLEISERALPLQRDLLNLMETHVYPAENVYEAQMCASGDPRFQPPFLEDLKSEARERGLRTPLAMASAHLRTLRVTNGPDEVHKRSIIRQELRSYRDLRPKGIH